MDRHLSPNKGFTIIEVCIAVLAISILSLVYLPMHTSSNTLFYAFAHEYLQKQSEAILTSQSQEYTSGDEIISFNKAGNVKHAQTIHFDRRNIIIELGGGRLVFQ